jgi:hypothetical protein
VKDHLVRVRNSKRTYHARISRAEAKQRNKSCFVAVSTNHTALNDQALRQHEARTFVMPVRYGNRSSITNLHPQSKCIPGANIRPVLPCSHYVPHSNLKLCYLQHTTYVLNKLKKKTSFWLDLVRKKTHTRYRINGTTAHYEASNTNIRQWRIEGGSGVIDPPPRNSKAFTKLSRIPCSMQNTSVTT